MKLSVSSLAWNPEDDSRIADILVRHRVRAIELAPAKYFDLSEKIDTSKASRIRSFWQSRGISVVAFQGLLHGLENPSIFRSAASRQEILRRLFNTAALADQLGAQVLVFGAPRARVLVGQTYSESLVILRDFFGEAGDRFERYGTSLTVEPNPRVYGGDVLTNSEETAQLVRSVNHPLVKMQLDTGAIMENGENLTDQIRRNCDLFGHTHLSAPLLEPLEEGNICLSELELSMQESRCTPYASIEMLTRTAPNVLGVIDKSLELVREKLPSLD